MIRNHPSFPRRHFRHEQEFGMSQFDRHIPRYNTASVKWDLTETLFGRPDLLPLWVADMDFPVPQKVIDAIKARADHGIFGYTFPDNSYKNAVITWFRNRHKWEIKPNWIVWSPGVVPALHLLVDALSSPGDGVIIQRPVYYPFFDAIEQAGRTLVNNPLHYDRTGYTMDFADLRKKAADPKTTLMILSNPHNPVGRVWSGDELIELGEVCMKHNVTIISDEIHCDLILQGSHTPFGTLGREFLKQTVVCTSPSKTFNLAGMHTANIIIAEDEKRTAFNKAIQRVGLSGPNTLGCTACHAAYEYGEPWLDELLTYIKGNVGFLTEYMATHLPQVQVIPTEGTYLVWLDFRELEPDSNKLERLMLDEAKVALDEGYFFGPEGAGFERINVACPRSILQQALEQIVKVFQ
jgi:cystathionine beta-lyase